MSHYNKWQFSKQRNTRRPFNRSTHRNIQRHSTSNLEMEDNPEDAQNNPEELNFQGHETVENPSSSRSQPRIFYNNEETFSPLPDLNIPEFQSLSDQKIQGCKSSKKSRPFFRGHFHGNIRRGRAKQYFFDRRQSNPKNVQPTHRDESDESSENEDDENPSPIESSKAYQKSHEYKIEYLPNSVNVEMQDKIKNKSDFRKSEKSSFQGASNLNKLTTFRKAKDEFYNMMKSVSPAEIIMDYRQQIEEMSNYCTRQNLRKIEKILTLIREQQAYADIFKLHHSNLLLQQQNFDESVSSLKHECSVIQEKNAEDIIKKADNVKMRVENECSLFQRTLPAYAYKIKILEALKNYQVVLISADCSYFFNNVTPIIASLNLSDYSVISCESSSMSCSLVKNEIEAIMKHNIGNSDFNCVNEDEMLCYLSSSEKSPKNCFILNVPLKRSIALDLILASLLDILHQQKESKLILLLSMFDNISKYETYFSGLGVFLLEVPKLLLPVKTVWKKEPLFITKNYKEDVVCTALSIHILNEAGDVIAFLPCIADAKTALAMLIVKIKESKIDNVECFLLNENNSNVINFKKQMNSIKRKIFFSTHYAEAIPIPSVKYVIDCGLTRGYLFDKEKKLDVLTTVFSSRSRSRLRKSLVGVYSMGICYRIYNKENFCYDMSSFERPDILTLNPFNTFITFFHYMSEKALSVQFVDPLNATLKDNTVKQLKNFNAIKNGKLTELGKKMVKLPFTSRYSKLILQSIQWGIAYEAVILVAYFSTDSHLFQFTKDEEKQKAIDASKLDLLQNESDPLSFLYVFKNWMENNCNKAWCNKYFIESDTLNKVKVKVSEICQTVYECLNESIPQEFSDIEDLASNILELLFQCFADNLCVFSGHYRSGYRILTSRQTAFLHPSSILCDKQNMPQLIIFDKIICSSRYFLLGVSAIPVDMVLSCLADKTLDFEYSDIFERNLVSQTIEPVGERVIKQVLLGPEGKRLFEIEELMKKELKSDLIVVDPIVEKGCVNVYALEHVLKDAAKMVDKLLKSNLDDIIKAEKTYVLELEKGETVVKLAIKCTKGAKITSVQVKDKLEESVSSNDLCMASIKSTKENISAMKCSINLTWTRRPCNGMCYVSFAPQSFLQARRLAMRKINILQSEVYVEVSKRNDAELYLSDVPPEAGAVDVEKAIKVYLPHSVIDKVELKFVKAFETTLKDTAEIQMEIQENCEEYTNLVDFKIIVPKPKNTATIMTAYINVFGSEDLTEAATKLSNVMINNFKVSAIPVYRSIIKTNFKIYQAQESRIQEGIDKLKSDLNKIFQERDLFRFDVDHNTQSNLTLIKLLSNNMQVMKVLQKTVNESLEGEVLNKSQVSDIHKLFCHGGHMWLRTLEKSKKVFILEEYNSKTIRVYGSSENCFRVKEAVLNFLQDTENEAVEKILLSNDKSNRTLLKTLIKEYTVGLEPFVDVCGLRSAELDIKSCCVLLHGSRDSIERAKTILQHLSSNISSVKEDSLLSGGEVCPVCSCPAFNLTIRLQHCGHLYCNECILGLVEQAQFPIQCCAENCSEDIVLDDIIRILEEDEHKIKKLLESSLNDFLEQNRSDIFYCPAPDCRMFGYKSEVSERWSCPLCHNEICTNCNVVFHYGYTCDVYQGSKKDPDYSFKIWKKGTNKCKECPKCKTAIEKNEGCDHMTCISCKAHFCWVCCREFPSAEAVYNHIPFCDQYPRW